jgi:hypothetical protein
MEPFVAAHGLNRPRDSLPVFLAEQQRRCADGRDLPSTVIGRGRLTMSNILHQNSPGQL